MRRILGKETEEFQVVSFCLVLGLDTVYRIIHTGKDVKRDHCISWDVRAYHVRAILKQQLLWQHWLISYFGKTVTVEAWDVRAYPVRAILKQQLLWQHWLISYFGKTTGRAAPKHDSNRVC